jgi:hypothetical protein
MNTHLLPVPFELAELINSFAYYDWNTWIRLEKERLFMKDLHHRMMHCYTKPRHQVPHWSMWLAIPPCIEEKQFQAVFCVTCGNYLSGRYQFCTC